MFEATGGHVSRRAMLRAAVLGAAMPSFVDMALAAPDLDWATSLTTEDAAARIANGDMTAENYATALAGQATRVASLNIFIAEDREGMLAGARAIDHRRRAREKLGPLAGVPLLVKDNIDTASLPTTASTPALAHNRPAHDAAVLRKLLDAGALLFGKTNMDELAGGATSDNVAFGAVHNPYAPDRVPGGSSGGTAAGIAARVTTAGLGTDTGGSSRIPASLCGVVGLRPTVGRYPGGGHVPSSHTRDVIAPMARSVAGVAIMDHVISGEPAATSHALRGLRLGLPKSYFWSDLDSETDAVAQDAVRRMREAGVEFVDVDLPGLPRLLAEIAPILSYEAVSDLRGHLEQQGSSTTVEQVIAGIKSPNVEQFYRSFLAGTDVGDYRTALDVYRSQPQKLFADGFRQSGVSALCFPPTPITAPLIGQQTVVLGGKEVPVLLAYFHNGNPASATGLPALVIPAGLSRSGLPVGLEFDGPAGSDRLLLSIGLAIEKPLLTLPAPRLT